MTSIRAVIFDMDGVLVDAKEWHYEALNRALALFGYAINRYDHLVTYDGLPTSKKLELLSLDAGFPRSLHKLVNRLKQQYTLELTQARCRPQFHHQYAVARLKKEGYIVGVASNSIPQTIAAMMERSRLAEHLDFTLSNRDVARAKPDPEIYLLAAERAAVSPRECVVVEDNHYGVEAATRAGANVLRVHDVAEVTYERIRAFIDQVETMPSAHASPATHRREAA